MRTIEETNKRIAVGHPLTFAGLTVYPLTGGAADAPGYTTLDEALGAGTVRITETSDEGSVPELALQNDGDQPVLVLDGEELAGAKQNRIVNLTLLAPAKTKIVIPVSCVEAGRWSSVSEQFDCTPQLMYAKARMSKYADVSLSMAAGGSRSGNQGRVWDEIGMKQRELRSESPTSRMTDTFEQHGAQLNDYVSHLPHVEGQVGAVFALSGRVSCVELFESAQVLEKIWPKLVRSWALDALPVADRPHEVRPASEARDLLTAVAQAKTTEHEAIGLGTDLRFEGALSGGALMHEEKLVHLCVFRDGGAGEGGRSDDEGWDGWRQSRMTPPSRRRR